MSDAHRTPEVPSETFEKLGAFYLGRETDPETGTVDEDPLLYDSRDLVTHGVVLGMTGSGKTGLCLALLEEAAIDGIPAIAIDPKGDIANLLLTFPDLAPGDFRPWINVDDASRKGMTPDDFAAAQAKTWKDGLAVWGQDGERIRRLRERCEFAVYTPGSSAGIPVSVLGSLAAPPPEVIEDAELFGERIESTVSSLLALVGIDADPVRSREHILMSSVLGHHWREGRDIDLATLIQGLQAPPFTQVGVLDVETFFPEAKRGEFALQVNNLLASPGFGAWRNGVPLDVGRLMHGPDGRPRVAIFSIAHLNDRERMFFVSMLLNNTLAWMRSQPGTTSLRALLYMDEIFGFLPPTANPPSKKPMMTLLKQSRAYGLGLLLATQNPVDLDYKALSNIGTWFLGRLQTERDKARIMDGLEGAAAAEGGGFDRRAMERLLSGLGNRMFLLHNVHEGGPLTFQVRWVMSYLRGPLTRSQIQQLMDPVRERLAGGGAAAAPGSGAAPATAPSPSAEVPAAGAIAEPRPPLPRGIDEFFLRLDGGGTAGERWIPCALAAAEAYIDHRRTGARGIRRHAFAVPLGEGMKAADWSERIPLDGGLDRVTPEPPPEGARFAALPPAALRPATFRSVADDLEEWVYRHGGFVVLHSPTFDLHSAPGESEGEFRGRLALAAREVRDREVGKLRAKYAKEVAKLETKLARARETVEREKDQAGQARLDGLLSAGTAILGVLLGRKKIGVTTVTRGRTAARGASKAWKEAGDVGRASARVEEIEEDLAALEDACEREVRALESGLDPRTEELEPVEATPYKKDISIKATGLIWMPESVLTESRGRP